MVGRHENGIGHRVRGIVTVVSLVLLTALAAFGVMSLIPNGGETTEASSPILIPSSTSTVPHENHIALAHDTPAGQTAATNSDRVNRDRQDIADNPAARAIQDRINQNTPVMFGADTATLDPTGEAQVAHIVDILRTNPTVRVEVVGHTAVEIADPPLCLQLSQLRAEQVATRLEMAGIDPHRVSSIGISHMQPKDTAADSRRVELVVLSA